MFAPLPLTSMRILSKGSNLPFVHESMKWGESTNFKDYDIVFVNLQTLEDSSQEFDHPYNESKDSPEIWDKSDVTKFMKTGGHMVVYLPDEPVVDMGQTTTVKQTTPATTLSQQVHRGSKSDDEEDSVEPYSEYELMDWLPFSVEFDMEETGTSVKVIANSWEWYFGNRFHWEKKINGPSYDSSYSAEVLAENTYEENIAIQVSNDYSDDGSVALIPPNHSIAYSDFVNQTLENIFNIERNIEGRAPPSWLSNYNLPEESKIENTIEEKRQEIIRLEEKLESISRYKQLLYEGHTPLEEITREALRELGFTVEDEVPGKRDGVLHTTKRNFALEITGTSGGIKLRKARQLDEWVENVIAEQPSEDVSGLLIVNPEMGTDPKDREISVEPNVKRYMERRGEYKILTTTDLYELIESDLSEEVEKDSIEQMFYQNNTLLTLPVHSEED